MNIEANKQAVITGMGIISPVGNSLQEFKTAVFQGKCNFSKISNFDLSGCPFSIAGEIKNETLPNLFEKLQHRADILKITLPNISSEEFIELYGRSSLFACLAAFEALENSNKKEYKRLILVSATNFGTIQTALDRMYAGNKHLQSSLYSDEKKILTPYDPFSPNILIRLFESFSILNITSAPVISLSCSSGTAAIGYAKHLINTNKTDAVLCIGYDEISAFSWAGLAALRTMSQNEIKPFDKNRNGTLFSEGASALLIESKECVSLEKRRVLAEIKGFSCNNNAFHMTAPPKYGEGLARTMRLALRDALLYPKDISLINAHGTATRLNDITESYAIHSVFGEYGKIVPVTSTKSVTGHMMGAAGTSEAIASVLSICYNIIPPSVNLIEQDTECNLNIAKTALHRDVSHVLSNSSGIGGNNATLILSRTKNGFY